MRAVSSEVAVHTLLDPRVAIHHAPREPTKRKKKTKRFEARESFGDRFAEEDEKRGASGRECG